MPEVRQLRSDVGLLVSRDRLRSAFVVDVQLEALNLGVALVELNRGGFGAMATSPLDGAPSVTAKRLIPPPERKKLKEEAILDELDLLPGGNDDEE